MTTHRSTNLPTLTSAARACPLCYARQIALQKLEDSLPPIAALLKRGHQPETPHSDSSPPSVTALIGPPPLATSAPSKQKPALAVKPVCIASPDLESREPPEATKHHPAALSLRRSAAPHQFRGQSLVRQLISLICNLANCTFSTSDLFPLYTYKLLIFSLSAYHNHLICKYLSCIVICCALVSRPFGTSRIWTLDRNRASEAPRYADDTLPKHMESSMGIEISIAWYCQCFYHRQR
jgi:hypothetical protein